MMDFLESGDRDRTDRNGEEKNMIFTLSDKVSPPLCLLLGFQHFVMGMASSVALPLLLIEPLCMTGDHVAITELIGVNIVVAGIATLLQTIFGIRLPIMQGTSFAYLVPTLSILSQPQWKCPNMLTSPQAHNYSGGEPSPDFLTGDNGSIATDEGTQVGHEAIWLSRIREVNGAVMVGSLLQVALGLGGVLGPLLRYVGPLSVGPTVTVLGLSLVQTAAAKASCQWGVAILTAALIVVFSQCLGRVAIPVPCRTCQILSSPSPAQPKAGTQQGRSCCPSSAYGLPVFTLFPVLFAMLVTWLISFILTVTEVFPAGHSARTDVTSDILSRTAWFHVPYPGQYGVPTVSAGAVLGMMSGVLASVMESVGDYYACAQMSGVRPPPHHAINRGILTEGIASILGASMGTANGSTSYSQNIAAIGVTRVASRPVMVVAAVLLVLFGCVGKVGALFVTITEPILGGLFIALFGMITAVGLSQLGGVDMRRGRNQTVVGVSIFLGLCVPQWLSANTHAINTGSEDVDQILRVMLTTSMFVAGGMAFTLDNLLPGSDVTRSYNEPVYGHH